MVSLALHIGCTSLLHLSLRLFLVISEATHRRLAVETSGMLKLYHYATIALKPSSGLTDLGKHVSGYNHNSLHSDCHLQRSCSATRSSILREASLAK